MIVVMRSVTLGIRRHVDKTCGKYEVMLRNFRILKIAALFYVTSCILVEVCVRFRGN
jgi:hypothetical protein